MDGGANMAAHGWLNSCRWLVAVLTGGVIGGGFLLTPPMAAHAAIPAASATAQTGAPAAALAASAVLQVRAAVHQDGTTLTSLPSAAPAAAGQWMRIVFDLQMMRPGTTDAASLRPARSADGLTWTFLLDAPLSARAETQLRALPRRISGLQVSLAREGSPSISKITLRFQKPTALARHFLLPGRGGQQERLVLDFAPDIDPVPAMAAAPRREVAAPAGLTPPAADAPASVSSLASLAAPQNRQASQGPRDNQGARQDPGAQGGEQAPGEPAPGRPRPQTEPADAMPLRREEDELPPPPTGDSPLTLYGFFEAEGRWFPQDSRDGAPDHLIGSMAMEPTVEYSWKGGSQFLRFTGFARVDTVTENRTHADVREAKYVGVFGPLELTAGLDRRFWGVTEAVHLVNIINQVDTLEDVDFEDYLGQPLISAAYTTKLGTFSAFLMPYFRERLFPTGEDRPNLPVRVNRTLTQYESGDNNWHPDWALRWSLREGPVDLGLSYFSGFSRDPQLLLSFDTQGQPQLIPRYNLIDQVGIDLQATLGSMLLKFEGIHRWDPVKDYAAFAAGFEYTFYGVSKGGADLGVLAEYLYDERGKGRPLAPGIPPFSNVSPYDDDIFAGFRWSGNDINSTEILGGAIFDLDTKSKAFVIEASRRLGQNLRISLDGRFFTSVSTRDVLWPAGDDDFIQLKLQWHY